MKRSGYELNLIYTKTDALARTIVEAVKTGIWSWSPEAAILPKIWRRFLFSSRLKDALLLIGYMKLTEEFS
jgi:hypothetical protein